MELFKTLHIILVDVNKNTPIHSIYKYFLTFDVTKTRRNIFKIKNVQTWIFAHDLYNSFLQEISEVSIEFLANLNQHGKPVYCST